MNKVSCYMIAFQDPKRIEIAIRHILPYVDDIFVLDGGNPDEETWATLERLKEEISILRTRSWPQGVGYYGSDGKGTGWQEPERRNLCLDECKYEYILTIDTDELLHQVPSTDYFRESKYPLLFPRYNIITPSKHILSVNGSKWWPDQQLRFFNKTGVRYSNSALHCQPVGARGLVARWAMRPDKMLWMWHYRRAVSEEIDIASHIKVASLPGNKPVDHERMMVGPR